MWFMLSFFAKKIVKKERFEYIIAIVPVFFLPPRSKAKNIEFKKKTAFVRSALTLPTPTPIVSSSSRLQENKNSMGHSPLCLMLNKKDCKNPLQNENYIE